MFFITLYLPHNFLYFRTLISSQFRAHAMWVHLFVESVNVPRMFSYHNYSFGHCSLLKLGLTQSGSICLFRVSMFFKFFFTEQILNFRTLISFQFRALAMWVHLFVESIKVLQPFFISKLFLFLDIVLYTIQGSRYVGLFVCLEFQCSS